MESSKRLKPNEVIPQTVHVVLFGFGGANEMLAQHIHDKRSSIESRNLQIRISAVFTGRRGCAWLSRAGSADFEALKGALGSEMPTTPGVETNPHCKTWPDQLVKLHSLHAAGLLDVVCEAIPADYVKGEPAVSLARAMLNLGVHVVTANKAPVALALNELEALAATPPKCKFLFETAVMDGVPVFNMVKRCMPAARILGFEGILNSTTNVILSCMEESPDISFADGLARAQEMGIAETDPSGDIDGFDAAVKCVCLCRALLGVAITLEDVQPRDGIRGVVQADIAEARADCGSRLMLTCEGKLIDQQSETSDLRASCAVRLRKVSPDSPLYNIRGTSACVTFHTDVMGPVTIVSTDPTLRDTGYGLLSDLLEAVGWSHTFRD